MTCMNTCGLSCYDLHEYMWTILLWPAWIHVDYLVMTCMNTCGLSCYDLHEYMWTILLWPAWIHVDYLVMTCMNTCGLSCYDLHEYVWTILLWPAWIRVDYLVMTCMNTCGLSPGVLSSLRNCIHFPEIETHPPKTVCGRVIKNKQTNKTATEKWSHPMECFC